MHGLETYEIEGAQEAIDDFARERGFSDGLPIVAPTPERVQAALEVCGMEPDEILGTVPISQRVLDGVTLAVNAVMAGCRDEHLPLVRAAMQAMLQPSFNLESVTTTTHPAAPLLIVSGPASESYGLHAGSGVLGPGFRANAVVGRAVRLILLNVGDAVPGDGDKATHGHPGKYTYVLPERQDVAPWGTLAGRVFGDGTASSVTAVAAEAPRNVNDHGSRRGSDLLRTMAGTIASLGHNNLYRWGPIIVVMGPEHAEAVHRDGFALEDVQHRLYELAVVDAERFSRDNLARYRRLYPERFPDIPDASYHVTERPEDFIVVVSGGPGRHSLMIPTFGISLPSTVGLSGANDHRSRQE